MQIESSLLLLGLVRLEKSQALSHIYWFDFEGCGKWSGLIFFKRCRSEWWNRGIDYSFVIPIDPCCSLSCVFPYFFSLFLCYWKIELILPKRHLLHHLYLFWILQMRAFQLQHEEKWHQTTRISSMNFWESSFFRCNYETLAFLYFSFVRFSHAWSSQQLLADDSTFSAVWLFFRSAAWNPKPSDDYGFYSSH